MTRFALVLVSLVVACAPPRRPPTYAAELTFSIAPTQPQAQLSPAARTALATATTVAFSPPDECPDRGCGAAMSRLERAAVAAGFRGVSWNSLRGSLRTIDYARQHSVDLLFELDVLRYGVPARDLFDHVDATFLDPSTGLGLRVRDAAAVARRCIPGTVSVLRAERAVALHIKMSSVRDGQVLWSYRATHSDLPAGRVLRVTSRYKATSARRLQGQSQWKLGIGIATVVVAGVAALTSGFVDGVSGDKVDFPTFLYAAEAMVLGTGVYLLATSNEKAHWGYSTPEETLCVPARLATPTSATVDDSTARCTSACRHRRRAIDRAVRDLFSHVKAARKQGVSVAKTDAPPRD